MAKVNRRRRSVAISIIGVILSAAIFWIANSPEQTISPELESKIARQTVSIADNSDQALARESLNKLLIQDRAPKTGYKRAEFGNGWAKWGKCDTRQRILGRDLIDVKLDEDGCTVLSGVLNDPYTGKIIEFRRGAETSSAVQIDHVVALSDSWQKGAQDLTFIERERLANDDLELIAADGPANMQKSDSDAANWLPENQNFHCQYVARQIAVKIEYRLWVTLDEYNAMARVLDTCPEERLPAP